MTAGDGGVVLADNDLVGRTQHIHGSLGQGETRVLADDETTRQYGDVLQHSLAAVTETGSLHGTYLQLGAQTVHYQSRQCLALYILSNDEERTAALYGRFQDGQEILEVGNLLVIDEDIGILHDTLHLLGVSNEIGREITAVELHTLYHTDGGVAALGLLDGDDTVLADLLHGIGQELANLGVVVGTHSSHLLDLLVVVTHLLGLCLDVLHDSLDGLVDTALQIHGIGTGGDILQSLAYDGLSQYGSRGGTVAGIVTRLAGHALHELCTCILEGVCQFYFLGHGDTVLGDVGSTELLLDDDVASLGTQGDLYCVSQLIYALLHLLAGVNIEFDIFCHGCCCFRMLWDNVSYSRKTHQPRMATTSL